MEAKVDVERPSPAKERPTLQRIPTFVGMQTSCNLIDSDGFLQPAPVENAIERRRAIADGTDVENEDKPSYWLDINIRDDEDSKELAQLINDIKLRPFLRKHLSKTHQIVTPQVLSLSKSLFMVMRVLPPEPEKSQEIRHVACLAVEGLLLTVTTFSSDCNARVGRDLNISTRKAVEERELPEASISGALILWLLFQVQRVTSNSQALRKRCFAMDEALDQGIETVELEDIVDLKNQINLQVAVTEEQLECIESLKEAESTTSSVDFSNLKGSMGLTVATASANQRGAARLEKKVADLRQIYDSHRQDRINHRLELLTIVSAIFLPLTLMAGIWGMNFTYMPELQKENAYYCALSSMALVAVVQLSLFYRYGWLS